MKNILWVSAFAFLGMAVVSALAQTDSGAKSTVSRMDELTRRAAEGSAKANLGSLRAGLSIFYGDKEGEYPKTLAELVPKYVDAIPTLNLPDHAKSSKVRIVKKAKGKTADPYIKDTGGWLYFIGKETGELEGTVVIDCKHKDAKGQPMSSF